MSEASMRRLAATSASDSINAARSAVVWGGSALADR
jgi:hypothetical protein